MATVLNNTILYSVISGVFFIDKKEVDKYFVYNSEES